MDTGHPDPLSHADDGVTADSEALIECRDRMRVAARELQEARDKLTALMQKHLGVFLPVGANISRMDKREITARMYSSRGGRRPAQTSRFELTEPARIIWASAHWEPIEAHWIARAWVLGEDGKPSSDKAVNLEGTLFPIPDPRDEVAPEDYEQFCDDYVDNWMSSTPDTYKPLRPAQKAPKD